MKSLTPSRRFLRTAALAGVAAAVAFAVPAAFAADGTGGQAPENVFVAIVNLVAHFAALLLSPLVILTGWLLSPSWTMGDIINLRPVLKQMWILVSNIVYTVFAFALLGIAFINIFGIGGDDKKYQLKAMLPKFVVGILIVPFTWFLVSATLSVVNVLTASILTLPQEMIMKTGNATVFDTIRVPKVVNLDFATGVGSGSFNAMDCAGTDQQIGEKEASRQMANAGDELTNEAYNNTVATAAANGCTSLSNLLSGNGIYAPLVFYAYNIFRIQDVQNLPQEKFTSIKTILDLGFSVLFNLFFILVFGVILIALFAALFIRILMLWVYAIFSPVFGLTYFFGGAGPDGVKKALEHFTFKEFLNLAFVPVYVSGALALGLIVVSGAVSSGFLATGGPLGEKGDPVQIIAKEGDASTSSIIVGGGNFTINITGGKDGGINAMNSIMDPAKGSISKIIVFALSIVVLWLAVMAALKASKITEKIVSPIEKFAKTMATHTPLPFLPNGLSVNTLGKLGSIAQTSASNLDSSKLQELQRGADSFLGIKNDALRQAEISASQLAGNPKDARNMVRNLVGAGTAQQFAQRPNARKVLAARIREMNIAGVTPEMITSLENATTQQEVTKAMHEIEKLAQAANLEIFEGADSEASILEKMGKSDAEQKATAAKAKLSIESASDVSLPSKADPKVNVTVRAVKLDATRSVYLDGDGKMADLNLHGAQDQVSTLAKYLAVRDLVSISKDELIKFLNEEVGLKDPEAVIADISKYLKEKEVTSSDGTKKMAYEFSKDGKENTKINFRTDTK